MVPARLLLLLFLLSGPSALGVFAVDAADRTSISRSTNLSRSATRTLVRQARRLDQNNAGGEEESFLQLYSLKLIKCLSGQEVVNQETGQVDYSLVIFRLCPDEDCTSGSSGGCDSTNSADYAVGMSTFLEAYLDDQQDNMNQGDDANGDAFPYEDYAQCALYKPEDEDGNQGDDYFYLGPTCSDNQLDIIIGVFDDQYCTEKSSSTFSDISGGWSLPYSEGNGMVSTNCIPCAEWNDNDDQAEGQQYELRDFCEDLYDNSNYRCEAPDFTSHYYWDAITEVNRFGTDETGCNNINGWESKRPKQKTNWGEVFLLLILVAGSVAAGVYYTIWWSKQKENLELIDDDDDTEADEASAVTGNEEEDGAAATDDLKKIDDEIAASQQHQPMKDATFA